MAPSDTPDEKLPPEGASSDGVKDDRQARLEAALRANLKKRKAQARGRSSTAASPSGAPDEPEKA